MSCDSSFEVGDVVTLKSGGPKMTVRVVEDNMVGTVWLDDQKQKQYLYENRTCFQLFSQAPENKIEEAPHDTPPEQQDRAREFFRPVARTRVPPTALLADSDETRVLRLAQSMDKVRDSYTFREACFLAKVDKDMLNRVCSCYLDGYPRSADKKRYYYSAATIKRAMYACNDTTRCIANIKECLQELTRLLNKE